MRTLTLAALCALLTPQAPAFAASVFRCEDTNGNITFTAQGCPAQHSKTLVQPRNLTPSTGKAVPMATTKTRPKTSGATAQATPATIVGTREDGCGNQVTGSERRNAIIKKQIRTGMTRKDVESALGTPDSISRSNGQVRYLYKDRQGNKSQISFDQAGCVKGK